MLDKIFLPHLNVFVKIPKQRGRYPNQGIISKCHTCNKPLYVSLWRLKKYKSFYCSKDCIKLPILRICKYCGKEFFITPKQIGQGNGIFCSRLCFSKNQTKEGIVECVCNICSSTFKIAKSVIKKGGGKYCSRECYRKSISGISNVRWRGGYYQRYGYGFSQMVREVRKLDKWLWNR